MKLYLSGISEELKHLDFSCPNLSQDSGESWLDQVILGIQEGELEPVESGRLGVDIYKSQDLVVLKGQFQGAVHLLCSRCADSFCYSLRASFHCLFTKDKSFLEKDGLGGSTREPSEDIDIEFLDRDFIDLSDVVKEQLYLKIPFQPLCNEACKGLCSLCGQNQNTHPCQCHRLRTGTLAQGLARLQVPTKPKTN